MNSLPTGTITFVFTDMEGSTKLLERLGPRFPEVLQAHNEILEKTFEAAGGQKVRSEGDAFFVVFSSATSAVAAAVSAQRALSDHPWPDDGQVRVRMGAHTGEGRLGGDDYIGIDVHRAARIAGVANGGQVLISQATKQLVESAIPEAVSLKDLGEHHLKDLPRAEHIYQLTIEGLRDEFPPLRSIGTVPNNLPHDLTSFIGREGELTETVALLGKTRLLTLTGPGGTGKTRMSLQTARTVLTDFGDGVFFVELATLTDPGLVASTIAQALGLQESGNRPVMETLSEFLRSKRVLLVLDNFEQILEAAAVVGDLLRSSPELKVLVTSRAPLHLTGEQEYPVPPLQLPDVDRPPPFEELITCEAVILFAERACLARPDFELTERNALAVAEISSRLDGLPLALEIAAARSKLLSPEAMLTRLKSTLDIGSARDVPARQQTLRGAIAWSYDLLDEPNRQLFRRLSVFVGGWTLDDAEVVCNPGDELGADTLSGIEFLLDQSLIKQQTAPGDPRFMMLETIREFGLERLKDEDDYDLIQRRHAGVFANLARAAEPMFLGPNASDWLERVEVEHDNLRATLASAIKSHEPSLGVLTAAALWRFWHLRGYLSEGRDWLIQLLELPEVEEISVERAKGLNALAGLIYWQGDFPGAKANYESALEIFRTLGDRGGVADVLYSLGFIASIEMNYERSGEIFAEAEEIYRQIGNKEGEARSMMGQGFINQLAKNYEPALVHARRAREALMALGLEWDAANAEGIIGKVLDATGDFEGSRVHHLNSIELFHRLGDISGVAFSLEYLARVAVDLSLYRSAIRMEGAADALKESLGGGAPVALIEPLDTRAEAKDFLTAEEIASAWEEGRSMTLEDAIAFARSAWAESDS